MEANLRPMSLGEILDRTAQLYRTNFLLFAGIAAANAGVLLIINLGQLGLTELLQHLHRSKQLPWATGGFLLLIFPLIVVSAIVAVAANNRAVAWVNLGQPATIVDAYRSILPRLGRYVWLSAIIGFFIYGPFLLLAAAYVVFLFGYAKPHGGLGAAGGAHADGGALAMTIGVSLVFILLCLAYVVYAILMGLRYSLAIAACVVEDLKARKAIRRSIELSKGSRGRIFVLGLLIAAIQLGLVFLTQIVFLVAIFMAAKNRMQPPLWIQITQQFVAFLTNSFIGPMYATGLTLFYYDQRIRKEGFDIEWMMEAAGMTAALPAEASVAEAPSVGLAEDAGPAPAEPETPIETAETSSPADPDPPPDTSHG